MLQWVPLPFPPRESKLLQQAPPYASAVVAAAEEADALARQQDAAAAAARPQPLQPKVYYDGPLPCDLPDDLLLLILTQRDVPPLTALVLSWVSRRFRRALSGNSSIWNCILQLRFPKYKPPARLRKSLRLYFLDKQQQAAMKMGSDIEALFYESNLIFESGRDKVGQLREVLRKRGARASEGGSLHNRTAAIDWSRIDINSQVQNI